MKTLRRSFDTIGDGSINYQEFLRGIRGPMNARRCGIIEKTWNKISLENSTPTVNSIVNIHTTHDTHPEV